MEQDVIPPSGRDHAVIIKVLVVFRMVAVSFFLGAVIVFQIEFGSQFFPLPLSLLIVATYTLSIIYLGLVDRIKNYTAFLYVQLIADLLVESGIIYYTGGVGSPFTFLYMLTIVSSVIIMQANSSYVLASGASILYGLLVNLEYYGVITPRPLLLTIRETIPGQGYVFFTVLVHIAAFYLVAFLSDFLSRRLKYTLLALMVKSNDLTYLQAFHQNVIATMGSGFMAIDLDGKIASTNPAAERILERGIDSFLKKSLAQAFPSLPIESIMPVPTEAKKTEWSYVTDNGQRKLIAVTSSLFRNSDQKVLGVIAIFQDITHFKKMEEAVAKAERMAAMGRMAAGLAHEIRNPLGSISGSIQVLRSSLRKDMGETNERLMAIVLRETERLNGIITRFLSYASPSTRKAPDVNLSTLISDSALLFGNDVRYSELVRFNLRLDGRMKCECDAEALKQVFLNLMLNAAQAMPEGGEIKISMDPVAEPGGEANVCEIRVSDTGCGISEEGIGKVFEPFYTTKEGGTGLGLPLAAKIIESHDGTISVQCNPGEETTFIIRLPISPVTINNR